MCIREKKSTAGSKDVGKKPDLTFTFHNSFKDHTIPSHLEGNSLLMECISLFFPLFLIPFFFQFTIIIVSQLLKETLP